MLCAGLLDVAVRMKYLCVIVLILYFPQDVKTEIPEIPVIPVIRGIVGDSLILPCYLRDSLTAENLDVLWHIKGDVNSVVHQYKKHQDVTDRQLPEYRNRTSLFREELQKGNATLKLTNVRISDTNTYRCYVSAQQGYNHDYVEVQVKDLDLKTFAESHVNGSATLICETTNWVRTANLTLEWLDSMGVLLRNTHVSNHDFTGTTLIMQAKVTVQEKANNSYTCRVSNQGTGYKREMALEVSRNYFIKPRMIRLVVLVIAIWFILLFVVATRFRKNSQPRVLQRYRRKAKDQHSVQTFLLTDQMDGQSNEPNGTTDNVTSYTKLLIVLDHGHLADVGEIRKRDYQKTSVEKLLSEDAHNLVILQGESGYGKSSTAEKILHDWQSGSSDSLNHQTENCVPTLTQHPRPSSSQPAPYLKRYDLVFLLQCDELSLLSEPNSLLDIVSSELKQKYSDVIKEIMNQSPQKILFVIDGLDELGLSEEDAKESPNDPFTPAQPKTLVGGLLSGRILPAASMLVTTRLSTAATVKQLCKFRPWKCAQILGFTEDAVKMYCKSYGANDTVFESLKKMPVLFASCSSPLFCWIICEAMKKKKDLINTVELGTSTSVYLAFFGEVLESLSQLFQKAREIIEGENVQLDLRDILKDGDPFRCSMRGHRSKPFIHRSFLEFFASISYTMLDDNEAEKQIEKLLISANQELSQQSPCKSYIQVVLKFLFGLSNKNIEIDLQTIFSHRASSHLLSHLKQWILERSSNSPRREDCLFLLQCLYEFHDEDLLKEAMERMKGVMLHYTPLNCTDCSVLQYCLTVCPSIKRLDLRQCNLTSEKLKLLEQVWNTLQCDDLRLTAEALGYTHIDELMKTIIPSRSEQSKHSEDRKDRNIWLQFLKSQLDSKQMEDLTEENVPCLLKTSQSRKISSFVSIEVNKDIKGGGDYLSFSADVSRKVFCLKVEFRKPESSDGQLTDPEVLSISLTLPSSQVSSTDWPNFPQRVLHQRQHQNVLEYLCIPPELEKLEIQVTRVTMDWASDLIWRLHDHPNLTEVTINAANKGTLDHCDLSCVTLERDDGIKKRNATTIRDQRRRFLKSHEGLFIKYSSDEQIASITLPTAEVSSQDQSTQLLTVIHKLKNREDQEKSVKDLLSKQVAEAEVLVDCIPLSLAETVLSFDKVAKLSIVTKRCRDEENLCSKFHVVKDDNMFSLKMKDEKVSSGAYSAPVLSGFELESDQTPADMNWKGLLKTFHTLGTLKKSNPEVDEHVHTLLSCLLLLRGLKVMKLYVSCLRDCLKEDIQALRRAHPGLSVRVSHGYNIQHENLVIWGGMDVPIELGLSKVEEKDSKQDDQVKEELQEKPSANQESKQQLASPSQAPPTASTSNQLEELILVDQNGQTLQCERMVILTGQSQSSQSANGISRADPPKPTIGHRRDQRIYIKKVRKFPEQRVPTDPKVDKKVVRQEQEKAFFNLRKGPWDVGGVIRYYVQLPTQKAHLYHDMEAPPLPPPPVSLGQSEEEEGEGLLLGAAEEEEEEEEDASSQDDGSCVPSRLHPLVAEKITQLVAQGHSQVYTVRKPLRKFVEREMFRAEKEKVPERHNLCYFPTVNDIKNHIHEAQKTLQLQQGQLTTHIDPQWAAEGDDLLTETVTLTLTPASAEAVEGSDTLSPEAVQLFSSLTSLQPKIFAQLQGIQLPLSSSSSPDGALSHHSPSSSSSPSASTAPVFPSGPAPELLKHHGSSHSSSLGPHRPSLAPPSNSLLLGPHTQSLLPSGATLMEVGGSATGPPPGEAAVLDMGQLVSVAGLGLGSGVSGLGVGASEGGVGVNVTGLRELSEVGVGASEAGQGGIEGGMGVSVACLELGTSEGGLGASAVGLGVGASEAGLEESEGVVGVGPGATMHQLLLEDGQTIPVRIVNPATIALTPSESSDKMKEETEGNSINTDVPAGD